MADPISHADMTSLDGRRDTYRLCCMIERLCEGEQAHSVLAALSMSLKAACDEHDCDVDDVLMQVMDACQSGDLAVAPNEVEDIDEDLPFTH